MNIKEWLLKSSEVVKHLAEGINYAEISLKEAEEKILEHINNQRQDRLWWMSQLGPISMIFCVSIPARSYCKP